MPVSRSRKLTKGAGRQAKQLRSATVALAHNDALTRTRVERLERVFDALLGELYTRGVLPTPDAATPRTEDTSGNPITGP